MYMLVGMWVIVEISHYLFFVEYIVLLSTVQGSYRSSVAKFLDFFPDFSCHGMTISLTLSKQQPYRTNVTNGTL